MGSHCENFSGCRGISSMSLLKRVCVSVQNMITCLQASEHVDMWSVGHPQPVGTAAAPRPPVGFLGPLGSGRGRSRNKSAI